MKDQTLPDEERLNRMRAYVAENCLPAPHLSLTRVAPPTWRTDAPPKDGSLIVAIGNITREFEDTIDISPFTESIRWDKSIMGWVDLEGFSVATYHESKVAIHFWLPRPE